MAALPHFETCLVCDAIRPEANGKLILLGFLGVCPYVDISVSYLDQPTVLTFLVAGGPGDASFSADVAIVDEDEQTVARTAVATFTATPTSSTTLAPAMILAFGHPGTYSVRLSINGAEHFRTSFRVSQG